MKVSEITVAEVATYLRLDETILTDRETAELEAVLKAAKAYVTSYTGLDDAGIDLHEEISIAVLVLCQDMYDNRTMYVESNNVSRVVETILGMHCVNLL